MSEAAMRETIRRVPLRRLGKTEEVSEAVLSVITNDFFNGKGFRTRWRIDCLTHLLCIDHNSVGWPAVRIDV